MGAKTNQHDADSELDRARERFGDGPAERKGSAGEGEQGQGVADPPGQAMLDDVGDIASPHGDAGDRGHVIGLERVLQSQEKPEPQNSEHV